MKVCAVDPSVGGEWYNELSTMSMFYHLIGSTNNGECSYVQCV